jgi:hypothetical protein
VGLTLDSEQAWQLLHSLRDRPVGQHVIAVVLADSAATGVRAFGSSLRQARADTKLPNGLKKSNLFVWLVLPVVKQRDL